MVLWYACIGATTWPHSAPQSPMASTFSELWILEGASNKLGLQKAKGRQKTKFHRINGLGQSNMHLMQCS